MALILRVIVLWVDRLQDGLFKGIINSNPTNLGLYIQNEQQKISASNDIKEILRKNQKIKID